MRSKNLFCGAWVCAVLLASAFLVSATELGDELPAIELTGGGWAGDGVSEGFGDILAPIYSSKSGLVFVNPRASFTDNSSEEYNIGLGYRHLLSPRNLIFGANVYYDYRETPSGSHFNQVGFGLEALSDWVDARANYYVPEDKKETINEYDVETVNRFQTGSYSSGWGDPYGAGNSIVQDNLTVKTITTITTKQHFEQYEEAMEGWDCEVGVRLPIPAVMEYTDVKVFGGYYRFNSSFGDEDIKGFKGRLEIRALPALYLDAGVYQNKDLAGSDYFVGARMRVPFTVANISKGRNPFEGAVRGFVPSGKRAPFASRLTEMVLRDLHVRTEVSEVTEDLSKRAETSASSKIIEAVRAILVTNANFVDGDNRSGVENGTAEHPYDTISEAVANAVGNGMIYVNDTAAAYTENVVLKDGQVVWGSGVLIEGQAGKTFGSGICPVVDGFSGGPTFHMANNTTLRGLHIVNTEDPAKPPQAFYRPEWGTIDIRRVGVFSDNAGNITLDRNTVDAVQYGALLGKDGSFTVSLTDNDFSGADLDGVRIAGLGSSGTFIADVQRNTFSKNGGGGLEIMAGNYDSVNVSLLDVSADGNADDGVLIFSDNGGPVTVTVDGLTADGNGNDGIKIQAYSADDFAPVNILITNSTLNDNGFSGAEVFAGTVGDNSGIQIGLGALVALRNTYDGLYADTESLGAGAPIGIAVSGVDVDSQKIDFGAELFAVVNGSGDVDLAFDRVNANGNGNGGIYANARMVGASGRVRIGFTGVAANDNKGDGFYVNAQTECGSAAVRFIEGTRANGNGGAGILVKAVEGGIPNGLAWAYFDQVNADSNTGAGIWIGNMYCGDGQALFSVDRSSASENGGAGIQVDKIESDGNGASTLARLWDVEANGNGGDGICFSDVLGQSGPVTVEIDDVDAGGNGGHGVYVRNAESYGADAMVSVQFTNVTADFNNGHGIYSYVISHDGAAQADFSDISANGNGSNGICLAYVNAQGEDAEASASFLNIESSANSNRGIYACVLSQDGPASALFEDVDANANRREGLYLDYVKAYGAGADAEAVFRDVEASGNGGHGVYVQRSEAYGADALASVQFTNVTADLNKGHGIYSYVISHDGAAQADFSDIRANGNGSNGICLAYINAQGEDAQASASFLNVESSANSNRGIHAYVSSLDGPASALFEDVVANVNRREGIYLDYVNTYGSNMNAEATFRYVEATGNGRDGIAAWACAYGTKGDAYMTFEHVQTYTNRGCGIYAEVSSEHRDAYLTGDHVGSVSNRQDGVQIYTYALGDVWADFGNGAQGSPGHCWIYGNLGHDMNNTASDPVIAQSNWWGSVTPEPGQFSGNIDRGSPLASDPNL